MNPNVVQYGLLFFTGALMLALPHYAPRDVLFGVRVGVGFRASQPGRAALRIYYLLVSCGIAAALAITPAWSGPRDGASGVWMPLAPEFAGLAAYLRNYFHLRRYRAPADGVREAELDPAQDRLPRWVLLAAPPFVLPAAAIAYLRAHWGRIPARYPVRWAMDGTPNRWIARTASGVYGVPLYAAGLLLLLLFLGLATFYGARKSPNRTAVLGLLIGLMYLLSFVFTGIGISPLVKVSPWALTALTPLAVVGILAWAYRRVSDPTIPTEPTPDECWVLGAIYYNPQDPAMFVQKRMGWGYTFNFGNRWTWVVAGVFLTGIAGLSAFMAWSQR